LQDMNVKDARTNYLPKIDASGRYQFSDSVDFGWEKDNYDASVAAGYTIWDHGQREGTLAQAKSRQEGQYSRYNRTKQSLIFSVINAYYNLLEVEKLIDVDKQILERTKGNVKKIETFVEVGDAIEADIATAKVQQASDELAIINDMNNLELARANLAVIMALNPSAPISVVDSPDYEKYINTGIIDSEEMLMEDAISQAFDKRPELAEQESSLDVLGTALTLAKLQTWPRINADCSYNVFLDDYLRERDAFKNHKSWNVNARVSYPIFDGGKTRRIVDRAEIALEQLNENFESLKRSITLEVYQAYLSLERAKKSLDITRVQIEDAKMSQDIAQERYSLRMIILLELLDTENRYNQALINRVNAFYDYKIAMRSLEKAMGVLQ